MPNSIKSLEKYASELSLIGIDGYLATKRKGGRCNQKMALSFDLENLSQINLCSSISLIFNYD